MFIENGPSSYASKSSKIKEPKSSLLDNRSNNMNEFSNARSFDTNTNEGLEGSRQKSNDKNMNYQQQRFKYSNKR